MDPMGTQKKAPSSQTFTTKETDHQETHRCNRAQQLEDNFALIMPWPHVFFQLFIGLIFYQIHQLWSIQSSKILKYMVIRWLWMNVVVLQKHRIGLVGFCVDFGITGSWRVGKSIPEFCVLSFKEVFLLEVILYKVPGFYIRKCFYNLFSIM